MSKDRSNSRIVRGVTRRARQQMNRVKPKDRSYSVTQLRRLRQNARKRADDTRVIELNDLLERRRETTLERYGPNFFRDRARKARKTQLEARV